MTTGRSQHGDDFESLSRLLAERHSCRAFDGVEVPNHLIEEMVRLAGRSPSSCNTQPWHVVITRGAATSSFRDAMMAEAMARPNGEPDFDWPKAFEGAYRSRRRRCGMQLYESLDIAPGDRNASERQAFENFRLFGAPHVAIVSTDASLGTYAAVDAGAFVTCFMLAAQSLGIATVPQASIALHPRFIREWFGLAEERHILCAVSFGYRDDDHPVNSFRTERAPLAEIMTIRS